MSGLRANVGWQALGFLEYVVPLKMFVSIRRGGRGASDRYDADVFIFHFFSKNDSVPTK